MLRSNARSVLVVVCLLGLVSSVPARELAKNPVVGPDEGPSPSPTAPEADIPTIEIPGAGISPAEAAGLAATPQPDLPLPPPVIAFLELDPAQVQRLFELRVALAQAATPLVAGILTREALLRQLIEEGTNAPAIGTVVLEIRQLYATIVATHLQYRAAVDAELTSEQRDRLALLRVSRQLQPLLPAFSALGLL